jgi:hypothetical protein
VLGGVAAPAVRCFRWGVRPHCVVGPFFDCLNCSHLATAAALSWRASRARACAPPALLQARRVRADPKIAFGREWTAVVWVGAALAPAGSAWPARASLRSVLHHSTRLRELALQRFIQVVCFHKNAASAPARLRPLAARAAAPRSAQNSCLNSSRTTSFCSSLSRAGMRTA